ncbi:phosphotransferase family protein [Hutsoniella sourekii]
MLNHSDDWEFHPILGGSGESFMGVNQEEKLFFKRNISPFVTALSAKGITPRLMWTKRTYSGDTLTAQEWKEGRLLEKKEMEKAELIQLLYQVHHSEDLLDMLKRVGGKVYRPLDFLEEYFQDLPPHLASNHLFNEVVCHLQDSVTEEFYQVDLSVCHGDLHHHNFIMEYNSQNLYLVDWEKVRISDYLSDLSYLLIQYFPPGHWTQWLTTYQADFQEPKFYERIRWYSLINCLLLIKQYYQEKRYFKVNELILLLKSIYQN